MARQAGFIVDVPVYLTLAVRGAGLTEEQAIQAATDFLEDMQPSEAFISGYNTNADFQANGIEISEVSLGASETDAYILDDLESEMD